MWPTPAYNTITSKFGPRAAPTNYSSNYHYGVDIGAPNGSKILAITDGKITFVGWNGAGGYTITMSNEDLIISYMHCSPNFLVKKGDIVTKGKIIGYVGPKNIYGIPNNPYKDRNGKPTNGSTTGPHLHLSMKKDGQFVNPLNYF